MKTRLIFVRHAEAEGNVNRVFHGWTDGCLTQKGHLQAAAVARRLKDMEIDVIYSSSLKRTMQTADYISQAKGLPIIRTDKLKEINGGEWEGERWEDLPHKWPQEYETWESKPHEHKMPGGESMDEFRKRLIDEVMYIINRNKGKNICVVTHGTALRALQCCFYSCDLEDMLIIPWQDNTSVTIIDYEDGSFNVVVEGDSSHLGRELSTIENQRWWAEYKSNMEKVLAEKKKKKEQEIFVEWLFRTNAIRVCPPDKPFWYTSGTIGPYYINTHFLYGSEDKANAFLELIEAERENRQVCPLKLLDAARDNYANDAIYKGVIDKICEFVRKNIDLKNITHISGGERRDWFFSLIAADILEKPHIAIYKDLEAVKSLGGKSNPLAEEELDGSSILHIADLITEASSYERAWIPALRKIGGEMKYSLAVVDRMQGGSDFLKGEHVEPYSMVNIDISLFDSALSMKRINQEQYELIKNYINNPRESMRSFLMNNPCFLNEALSSDSRTAQRARLCIEKNIYDLNIHDL